jgi:hypothetical protein
VWAGKKGTAQYRLLGAKSMRLTTVRLPQLAGDRLLFPWVSMGPPGLHPLLQANHVYEHCVLRRLGESSGCQRSCLARMPQGPGFACGARTPGRVGASTN